MSIAVDNRQVVLLKSLRTNNRFYTLVEAESGFKNADAIEEFPAHLPLGIAYPCLEDGLNDFAVIRTTFETIDLFADDEGLREEMMEIIRDARGNLIRRLKELRDRITEGQAHFLGTNLQEFKDYIVLMATRGTVRRTLDNMMKLDVFESVAHTEGDMRGGLPEPTFVYQFLPQHGLATMQALPPRIFVGRLFDDVLDAVVDDENYEKKYTFDKHVFQKFIAVMFVNYATTNPIFYGTNRDDYGVSSDKDMSDTPLYQAVASALREIERLRAEWAAADRVGGEESFLESVEDLSQLFSQEPAAPDFLEGVSAGGHTVEIPFGAADRLLVAPLSMLADAARLLGNVDHPHADELRAMIANAGRTIFRNLQELKILSPLASDPMDEAEE